MVTRYRVNLDAQGLEMISPAIIITDIAYSGPRQTMYTSQRGGRDGLLIQGRKTESSQVTVTIEIHEPDIRMRQEICQRVQAWAMKGGNLTTNDRPGQRLRVICERPPVIGSALRWTQKLQIGFAAYAWPYWEAEREDSVSLTGPSRDGRMYVRGTAERTLVSVDVTNMGSENLNTLTLTAGDTEMTLESLGLGPGRTLNIGYDDAGNQYIRIGTTSKLHRRTPESDDDLYLPCGAYGEVSVRANVSATVVFKARGLYL